MKSNQLKSPKVLERSTEYDNKYKYNILKVIEKWNQEEEEEAIAELIAESEEKITRLFEFIRDEKVGKRLITKIKDNGLAFTQEEIYTDFERLYRKFLIIDKSVGIFFKKETKDILNQLCDGFEIYISKR